MVATHINKIKHSMLHVTGVYLRDKTNMIFVILHLNLSCLSICCSASYLFFFAFFFQRSHFMNGLFIVFFPTSKFRYLGVGLTNFYQFLLIYKFIDT